MNEKSKIKIMIAIVTIFVVAAIFFLFLQIPTAKIESILPNPVVEGDSIFFIGSGAIDKPGGYITAYEWDLNNSILSEKGTFTTQNLPVGLHTIQFKVKDNYGRWSKPNTSEIKVLMNHPPTAYFDSILPGTTVFKGTSIYFSGHGEDSDLDDSIIAYEWSINNSILSDKEVFDTQDLSNGMHIVQFRVKDKHDKWSEPVTSEIKINPFPIAFDQKNLINSIGMEFIEIQSGEFYMGSRYDLPIHKVTIAKTFYIGKYEVTQRQWRDVMGNDPSYFKGDYLPAENITWYEVQDFIKKLNEKEGTNKYRLPSEAEWEYVARAGTNTQYFFGYDESQLKEYAWYGEKLEGKTHQVGLKKPNPWGLYDIYGNVWEWVQDKWHWDYDGAPTDGSAWESGDDMNRVDRGGSWFDDGIYEPSSSERHLRYSNDHYNLLGFRLVRDL